jgi:hypothetical protein
MAQPLMFMMMMMISRVNENELAYVFCYWQLETVIWFILRLLSCSDSLLLWVTSSVTADRKLLSCVISAGGLTGAGVTVQRFCTATGFYCLSVMKQHRLHFVVKPLDSAAHFLSP